MRSAGPLAGGASPAGSPGPNAPLELVLELGSQHHQVRHVVRRPAREARLGRLSRPLPAQLERALSVRGQALFTHQVAVIDALRAGRDVVVTTGTASGKTLAFQLAVLEQLVGTDATALALFPTKALAQDQLRSLSALVDDAGLERMAPAVYDGDTASHRRREIRERSRIVLTNPHALHHYLPHHQGWARFFARLAVVVVDEAHAYRGVVGANVALVLRRLQRLALRHGAEPRFVLASATVGNPAEHAGNLVGRPVQVIDDDGAPRPESALVLWDAMAEAEHPAHRQAAWLLARLAGAGFPSLCFTPSRQVTELVARWASETAPWARIRPYRAGYRPEDRRVLEQELATGALDGMACTTALELGIDVGGLDAVVLDGYPGTVASTWQQAGRAGRSTRPAVAVLVIGADPLERYLLGHPERVVGRPHEHAVVDLANARLAAGHLLCAAAEAPLRPGEATHFGPSADEAVSALRGAGALAPVGEALAFHGGYRPVERVRLDSVQDVEIRLLVDERHLESLQRRRALFELYPGAVYHHMGSPYVVRELDLDAAVARAEPTVPEPWTEPRVRTRVRVLEERRTCPLGIARVGVGPVELELTVTGYRRRSAQGVEAVVELDLPTDRYPTSALWLSLPSRAPDGLSGTGRYFRSLHALEHALVHMVPLLAMSESRDVHSVLIEQPVPAPPAAGLPSAADRPGALPDLRAGAGPGTPPSLGPAVVLADAFPGGAGLAEVAFERVGELASMALELLEGCDCREGCPSCLFDRRCPMDNARLSRSAGADLLRRMVTG